MSNSAYTARTLMKQLAAWFIYVDIRSPLFWPGASLSIQASVPCHGLPEFLLYVRDGFPSTPHLEPLEPEIAIRARKAIGSNGVFPDEQNAAALSLMTEVKRSLTNPGLNKWFTRSGFSSRT